MAAGHIAATRVGSRPVGRFERIVQVLKGTILGSPIATAQSIHERLTKIKALAILGSDPLSSSAYATEEALILLTFAGTAGLDYLLPIGVVVAALLVLVMMSCWETTKAYPGGGGAYAVSHDNLGRYPGLVAAGALMVDYTLLVSVSVSAGVAAVTSAVPELFDYRVPMAVFFVIFFTLGNLRGVPESGSIFAAPTYFFIVAMGSTVAVGFVRVLIGDSPGSFTEAGPPAEEIVATQGLTIWLVLRAFSSGASALTGVETIANGTPTFKPPEAKNARMTMAIMAGVAIYMFLGITFVVSRFGLVPETDQTLVSALGRTVWGENVIYYVFQATTAMVLFLAANSSFNAFSLLGSILARDHYLPRQFNCRGDRLAFSNGILVLAVVACVLLVIYDASVAKLIPLYADGVKRDQLLADGHGEALVDPSRAGMAAEHGDEPGRARRDRCRCCDHRCDEVRAGRLDLARHGGCTRWRLLDDPAALRLVRAAGRSRRRRNPPARAAAKAAGGAGSRRARRRPGRRHQQDHDGCDRHGA